MIWLFLSLIIVASFVIGAGLGYNQGQQDQVPQARQLLDQAAAERRRARDLAVSARYAADLV